MVSVHVLIVSFNTRDVLRGTLTSLVEQAPPRDRIEQRISVLDNASSDGSADVVAEEFPQATLVRCAQNSGFARATNLLAETSDADYVLLLNPDVILVEDVVSPLVAFLEEHPDAAVVAPRLLGERGAPQASAERFPDLTYELARVMRGTKLGALVRPLVDLDARLDAVRSPSREAGDAPTGAEFVWATCWLLRRADVERHGLFDESFRIYDEDLDFCRRLAAAGRKVVYVPSVRLIHLGGRASSSETKRKLTQTARTHYYRKHHGRATAAAFHAIGRLDDLRAARVARRSSDQRDEPTQDLLA